MITFWHRILLLLCVRSHVKPDLTAGLFKCLEVENHKLSCKNTVQMIGGLTCIALMFFLETCKSMDLSVYTNDSHVISVRNNIIY